MLGALYSCELDFTFEIFTIDFFFIGIAFTIQ